MLYLLLILLDAALAALNLTLAFGLPNPLSWMNIVAAIVCFVAAGYIAGVATGDRL